MLFNKETILFNINSVPVIGNFDTGSLIGLTESGKAFCDKIINSGIEAENVEPENLELFQALCQAGFFEEICVNKSLSAYLHVTQRCNLHCVGCYSLDTLTSTQRRRLYAHLVEGKSSRTIAKEEGVNYSKVDKSIAAGIKKITKFFKNGGAFEGGNSK